MNDQMSTAELEDLQRLSETYEPDVVVGKAPKTFGRESDYPLKGALCRNSSANGCANPPVSTGCSTVR